MVDLSRMVDLPGSTVMHGAPLWLTRYPIPQDEQELSEKKQGQYNTMEKRGSDLTKEVKILQEALADFNTVLDKVMFARYRPYETMHSHSRI